MRLLSWNIQWGRGADGRVDLARTIDAIRALGEPEVLCLQEVARNFSGLKGGGPAEDGLAVLKAAFPRHEAVFAPALDVPAAAGRRAQFGNLLLTALPLGQIRCHLLPAPADPPRPAMQRGCIEAVIEAPAGPLRILTTHLEYHSARQRLAQVEALRRLQAEVVGEARAMRAGDEEQSRGTFAARPRPAAAILCGDFNCEPGSLPYRRLQADIAAAVPPWRDVWPLLHPGQTHAPTVGVHGAEWPGRQYCCDFFFASADLLPRLRAVQVLAATAASDHQPVLLELDA